ncbi:hypothetical protein SEA_KEELAN_57 [Gordonia phage Keelan]|nr:hypothetical protein SEA_KEELAN_57 [Gordonia phage Keelan]
MATLPTSVSVAELPSAASTSTPLPQNLTTAKLPTRVTSAALAGAVASLTLLAHAGTVSAQRNIVVSGPVASVSFAAIPGGAGIEEFQSADPATFSIQAIPGTVSTTSNVTLSGPAAQLNFVAGAGLVVPVKNVALLGVEATLSVVASAGSVSGDALVVGETASIAAQAESGTLTTTSNVTISGPTATLTLQGEAGLVAFDVIGSPATISFDAPAGTVTGSSSQSGPAATLSVDAPAGTVSAQRNITITGPTADISLVSSPGDHIVTGQANTTQSGPVATLDMSALAGTVTAVLNFSRQQINKDVYQSVSSTSNTIATMTSDATYPATVVSNGIEVVGATNPATIHAFINSGRNNISGNAIFDLLLNGVAVDSYTLTPVQQMANNSTSPAYRPIRLQWSGSITAGDDIQLAARRTISTSGYMHPGTYVYIEPGNTTYTMQAMYKNTSNYSLSTTQSTVTGWVADSTRYTGSSVNASHQLETNLVGTGGVRAHIACDSGAAVSDFRLIMNGTEIGSVTIPASDQSGYWINVSGITFDGSDLIWLTASRPGASRNVVANLSIVEAYVSN